MPIKWVKKFNLQKGDEIDVEEKNNNIVISTEKSFKINKKEINTSDVDSRVLKWLLSALHKSGNDEVIISFDNPGHMKIIQERVGQLLGYAIIEQSHNKCVIRNISEALENEFDSTLKRAFLVTLSMAEGVYDIISNNKGMENLQSLINLEETNNQLTGFCHRILNKKGYKDPTKTTFIYIIIWLLESIADEYRDICNFFVKDENKNTKISKDAIDLFSDVNDLVRMFYNVFYDFNDAEMVKIANLRENIRKRSHQIMQNEKSGEVILVNYLNRVAQRIYDSIGSVLAMNH